MKTYAIFLILTIISNSLFAQYTVNKRNVNVTMSEPYPVIDGSTYLLSNDGNEYKTLELGNSGETYIRTFDKKSLALKSTLQSEEKIKSRSRFNLNLKDDNGQETKYIIYTNYEIKKEKQTFSFIQLDIKNESIEMIPKKSMEIDLRSNYDFAYSENKKYFFFSYTTKLEGKVLLTSIVLDCNLNEVWKKETLFENTTYLETHFSTISNELKVNQIFKEYKVGDNNNKFIYVHFEPDNQSKSQLVSTEGGNKYNVSMEYFNNKNGLNIFGFYTPTKEYEGTHSLFMMTLNKDGEVVDEILISLPKDKMSLYSGSESDIKKQNKDKRQMKMLSCKEHVDGKITIIGEEIEIKETQSSINTFHKNYVVIQLNQDKSINWIRILPKNNMNTSSCDVDFNDDFVRIYYLDNPANLALMEDQIPKRNDYNQGYLSIYDIDLMDGSATKRSLFNILEVEKTPLYQFGFHRIEKISETELLIEFYAKKKRNVWIRVEL